MALTKSFSESFSPAFGDQFQGAITIPIEKPSNSTRNKIPITIHLSKVGPQTSLGCYVYTIPAPSQNRTTPFYQTLLNNAEETLVDMTKRVGGLITKKYNVPSYVSLSGPWELEDLIPVVKELVSTLESKWIETM